MSTVTTVIDHSHPRARHARLVNRAEMLHRQLDRIAEHDGLRDDRAIALVADRLERLTADLRELAHIDDDLIHALPSGRTAGEISVALAEVLAISRAVAWWEDEAPGALPADHPIHAAYL